MPTVALNLTCYIPFGVEWPLNFYYFESTISFVNSYSPSNGQTRIRPVPREYKASNRHVRFEVFLCLKLEADRTDGSPNGMALPEFAQSCVIINH